MFLKVSMFALALCSVRAEDLDCAELLQPLEDQHPPLGRSIILAAGSNNAVSMDMIKKSVGSWVYISPAEEEDEYHVTTADKFGDTCFYRKGVANVWIKSMTLILKSKRFKFKHEGVFLRTLSDDVDVWLHQNDHKLGNAHFKGKSITLLKRNMDVIVTSDTMERFRNQAQCEGIEVRELTADLCDYESTE